MRAVCRGLRLAREEGRPSAADLVFPADEGSFNGSVAIDVSGHIRDRPFSVAVYNNGSCVRLIGIEYNGLFALCCFPVGGQCHVICRDCRRPILSLVLIFKIIQIGTDFVAVIQKIDPLTSFSGERHGIDLFAGCVKVASVCVDRDGNEILIFRLVRSRDGEEEGQEHQECQIQGEDAFSRYFHEFLPSFPKFCRCGV